MEFVGQPRPSGACTLLVPGFSSLDVDDDEGEVVIGIRPKSSPLPRRRSSDFDDYSEPELPVSGSRRVSFADAKGLSLVQVKEFDQWDVPKLPGYDSSEGEIKDAETYFLSPLTFSTALSAEELFVKVLQQKVELETIELIPGTTILKGVIRVLNISFHKAVYIRTSLDTWSTHFDLLAEYIPGSSDGQTDSFSFKLTLVPPFGEQGARVDFCLRYETPEGTFWANNNNRNYVLFCQQQMKAQQEQALKDSDSRKSCLKSVSQSFSSVENASALETSSHENLSTDVPEEVETIRATETSEEDEKKLQTENKHNCSRRGQRKAARMARVRDYFAQRDGVVNDEGDISLPEGTPASIEEIPAETHTDMICFCAGNNKTVGSPFVDDTFAKHDKSQAQDYAEKPEKINPASLAGGEIATDIPDYLLRSHVEPSSSDGQCISMLPFEADKRSQNQECSADSSESLVNQSSSFTFGNHQVFGRLGSESQSLSANLGEASHSDADVTYPHTKRREKTGIVSTDARCHQDEIQGNLTNESNREFLDQICIDVPPLPLLTHQQSVNILQTDFTNAQTPGEGLYHQGTAQEDSLTFDLQNQTGIETDQVPIKPLNETLSETQDVTACQHFSSLSPPQILLEQVSNDKDHQTGSCESVDETSTEDVAGQTVIKSRTSSEEDKLLDAPRDLDRKNIHFSAKKEKKNSHVSCFEAVAEKEVRKPDTFMEFNDEINKNGARGDEVTRNVHEHEMKVNGEVVESLTKTVMRSYPIFEADSDISEKVEQFEPRLRDFSLTEKTEGINWEMMVEEEEKIILTNEQGSTEDKEAVEEEQGALTSGKYEDILEEKGEKTEENLMEIPAAEEEEADDVLVNNGMIREEERMKIEVEKEDVDDEYIQASKMEAGEEEIIEEAELWDRQEEAAQEHIAEVHEDKFQGSYVQEESEIGGEEVMVIDLTDEDEADTPEVKAEEEGVEEEKLQVDEAGEAEIVECSVIGERQAEVKCFEGRLDVALNKVEEGLSALPNSGQEAVDKEKNTREAQTAQIPTEMCLHKEEENVTHDPSEAAGDESDFTAVEKSLWMSTDDPESDQTSHDSGSAESDSDDEVELYMHCLRAVHTGAQIAKEQNKDAGFGVSKRSPVCRSKLLSTPMPSITESLDEDLNCLLDNLEDTETVDFQPTDAAPSRSSRQEGTSGRVPWWKETFSCSSISKTLLYASLFVVFLVVAYRYDFLACFGLYLISVVWLLCQGEKQQGKNNRIG
ncbi:uncharacterized protein ppp1r3ab [Aulostomus maculatus]